MLRTTRLTWYAPFCVRNGKAYKEAVTKVLTDAATARAYTAEAWGTKKDIRGVNGEIRKGEVGVSHTFRDSELTPPVTICFYNAEQLVDPKVMMLRKR